MRDINYFEINDGVLENYRYIPEVVIPNGVTAIGDSAFRGCESIQKVVIPNGVTTIEQWAFESCTNIYSVEIPDSVTKIGKGAFASCANLKKINIPDSVTSIETYAFAGCFNLCELQIPSSVAEIGEDAFVDCFNLVITAPEGSYAAEYIEENNLKPLDLDALLENVDKDDDNAPGSIRLAREIDEGYALTYYYLILKKRNGNITFIARRGCNEEDEDLNHAKMYYEHFNDERYLKLYALLVQEFNKSYESGETPYGGSFAAAQGKRKPACITPVMMAAFKEFLLEFEEEASKVVYGIYGTILDYI